MKKLAMAAVCMSACMSAAAQGFNPVVEVTNAFEGKIMEVQKHELEMAVPDSLLRFDYEFDYTTFENPYKGAYDFSPYRMTMTPEPRAYDGRNLFLRVGAGYSFVPEARLVWTPEIKGRLQDKFRVAVEDDFNGYWGRYSQFVRGAERDGWWPIYSSTESSVPGHDASNRLNMSAALDAGRALVMAKAGWRMINSLYSGPHDPTTSWVNPGGNSWNMLDGSLGIHSKGHGRVFADLDMSYMYGTNENRHGWLDECGGKENNVSIDARLGSRLRRPGTKVYMDLKVENERYRDYDICTSINNGFKSKMNYLTNLLNISATPTLSGHADRLNYSAGMNFSMIFRKSIKEYENNPNVEIPYETPKNMGHFIYPQVHIDYELIDDVLKFYANLGGGNRLDSYASMISERHFLAPIHDFAYQSPLGVENVCEVYSVNAGFSGRAHARFQYDIQGGVRRVDNAVCDAVGCYEGALAYNVRGDQFLAYVKADASWKSERLEANGRFGYTYGKALNECTTLLPAAFAGGFEAVYNWSGRIFAGLTLDAASSRSMPEYRIPGYVDLGINAEYKVGSRLSFWAKGGNLLGSTIHREVMYARKGAFFTVGLCLNL